MNTDHQPMYEWKDLPWRTIERSVFKLQKRIYQASQRGDQPSVHKLQRLLMTSWSAKCLAVRRVTQDNQGKKTAGVDGVKALSPQARMALVNILHVNLPVKPVRRVWIPKPKNPAEKRPLGIPTISNRAAQMLAKLALEPEWEAKFEPNSYGFRPGRSCQDAIQAIYISINQKPKFVLDADIAKCFDRINHTALLSKLHTFPLLRQAVKGWLKAGVMEDGAWFPTEEGSPQGGICSPLLANVALHGLEQAITSAFPPLHKGERWQPTVVRYADDFVVLHPNQGAIEQAQHIAHTWLAGMGLELKPSKTHLTHTLHPHEGQVGFEFLGFHIRQYPVGRTHSGKRRDGTRLGFKTLITPSPTALQRHQQAIKEVIDTHTAAPQGALIGHLNPLIRGWAGYYAQVCAKRSFSQMDTYAFGRLWHWAKRRHPNKAGKWRADTYWHPQQGSWQFATEHHRLLHYRSIPIQRHVKVQGTNSPFNGDWMYWTKRQGSHPDTPPKVASLFKRQRGHCPFCGLFFREGDQLEVDHILPTALGGSERDHNLQLLHRHCHDQKTAADGSLAARGADDNSLAIEEPDEVTSFTSGSEAERRGRPRRLGYPPMLFCSGGGHGEIKCI